MSDASSVSDREMSEREMSDREMSEREMSEMSDVSSVSEHDSDPDFEPPNMVGIGCGDHAPRSLDVDPVVEEVEEVEAPVHNARRTLNHHGRNRYTCVFCTRTIILTEDTNYCPGCAKPVIPYIPESESDDDEYE